MSFASPGSKGTTKNKLKHMIQICPARSEATCAHRFADEALTAAQEVLEVASASSRGQ